MGTLVQNGLRKKTAQLFLDLTPYTSLHYLRHYFPAVSAVSLNMGLDIKMIFVILDT